ncbi:hypothetical protein [Roseivirga spongicola]|uniref:hypothetical protein n=1 Tax=Roseivirga spongicola TaxID=333140 RepID=UPI000AE68721|nr:hypothetical protein [Roseivirga spongicola]WPZ09495.1 hypothetical protein T7867_14620 [Roseivirga spongicola]
MIKKIFTISLVIILLCLTGSYSSIASTCTQQTSPLTDGICVADVTYDEDKEVYIIEGYHCEDYIPEQGYPDISNCIIRPNH